MKSIENQTPSVRDMKFKEIVYFMLIISETLNG